MMESDSIFYDVLVIGSGIAGIRAAIEARKAGFSVVLLSKAQIGRQSPGFYAGGLLRPEPEEVKNVIGYEKGIEKYLYYPELVALCSKEAKKEVEGLISPGVPLEKRGGVYGVLKREQSGPGGSFIMIPLVKKARELGIIFLAIPHAPLHGAP